jgi:MSHA biogenesis protein MshQ
MLSDYSRRFIQSVLWLLLALSYPVFAAQTIVFFDDFEPGGDSYTYTATVLDGGQAGFGTQAKISGSYSLYLCCGEIIVTSPVIDTSAMGTARLRFWLRQGSDDFSEWPSFTDDLHFEIYLSNGTWQRVQTFEGGGSLEGDIYPFFMTLPANAKHANFRFRFYQIDGSGNNRDFWHIDDIEIADIIPADETAIFYDGFERNLLLSTLDWTFLRIDGNFTSEISNHTSAAGSKSFYTCCGVRYTTTRDIDLSGEEYAEISYWIRNGLDSLSGTDFLTVGNYDSEDPSGNDHLYTEMFLSDGTWRPIAFYEAEGGDAGLVRNFSARIPPEGLHSAFKIRFYQVDGTLSILRRYDMYHIDEVRIGTRTLRSDGVDHYRFSYGSSALTCNTHSVTIEACQDASCSTLYTDPVSLTLTPTGWVGGDTINFSGGSTTVSLAHTTPGTVTIGASSATPAISGAANTCVIDGGAESTFCNLTFADSGFAVDVNDFVANRATSATIRAVKKDDATQQCVPAFASVTKPVRLWSDYLAPDNTGRVVNWPVSVNGAAIGSSLATAPTQNLNFDATGQATVTVNYQDVGNTQLNVRYDGSGVDAGLVMTGNDDFVVYPAGLCVSSAGTCAAANSSCPAFVAAGDNFDLTVTAVAWESDGDTDLCSGNAGTPNYRDTLALSSVVLAPSPANSNGTVSPASYAHTASYDAGSGTGGSNTVSASQSEVGVFRFDVTAPAYRGYPMGTYSSPATGRFYPHHFTASVSEPGELLGACTVGTPLTYSGQSSGWLVAPEFSIRAENAANDVTLNYTQGGFMRLLPSGVTVSGPTQDNNAVASDATTPLPVVTTVNEGTVSVPAGPGGVVTYTMSALDDWTYTRSATAEVDSFQPDITYQLTAASDLDAALTGGPYSANPVASLWLRFGRMWLEDTYGPETSDLVMPLRIEYYDGGRYLVSDDDSCTTWDSVNASVSPATLTAIQASSGTVGSGLSGSGGILLQAPVNAPGTPDTGEAAVEYAAPSWLTGDYDNDGSFENPQGTATFGVYRGHEKVIYRRELR